MDQTIPELKPLFRRMQQLAQNSMIAGQKLRPIRQGDMNHREPHSQRYYPSPRLELTTLPWSLSLNQVDLLLALHLFPRQIRELI